MRILIEFAQKKLEFDGVVGLDSGGFKRNEKIAKILGCDDISFIIKYRDPESRKVDIDKSKIIGDVKGKRLISFDDFIQQGGTIETGAKIIKKKGARNIEILAVHNDFTDDSFAKINPLLENGIIDKLHIVETLPLIRASEWHKNLNVVSPDKFIAKVIEHVHYEKHMREFFIDMS
jgi:ribose-phosphate pyrophosphokinase